MAKKDNRNIYIGIAIILVGIGLFFLRPGSDCNWYNIFCLWANTLSTVIFFVLMILAIIIGFIVMSKVPLMTAMFIIFVTLLIIDIIIPDPLPLIDELLLMLGAIFTGVLSRKKK